MKPLRHERVPRESNRAPIPPRRAIFEAVVHRGLEDVAAHELSTRFRERVTVLEAGLGHLLFSYSGPLPELLALRTVSSLYLVLHYEIPRPRALLGEENLRTLLDQIRTITRMAPPGSYATLHLSAAGAESAVMRRLVAVLATALGLAVARDEADLHLRVRRPTTGVGWDVLIRLTPRPLSARSWRVCNMPGALNACVAAAMVLLAHPRKRDVFLNPCCGSGTLLIECAAYRPRARIIGCDLSEEALACAAENVTASGYSSLIEAHDWDARHVPLGDATADAICIDLPFGHIVGNHADNRTLHAEILREAARLARSGARCCLLTHQAELMSEILRDTGAWAIERRSRVDMGALLPTLFLLRRGASRPD